MRDWRTAGAEALATNGPGRRLRCPLCETAVRRFLPGPGGRQPRARCPRCGSLQRHRLLWLYLRALPELARPGAARIAVLHLAPEAGLATALRTLGHVEHTPADLEPAAGQVRADLQALPFADASFDVLLANHVLEHVGDDAAAFGEVHRVVRPGGFAILQVPVNGPVTREDPAATPAQRLALHGQEDHVRTYGRDVTQRVEAASGLRAAWVDGRDVADAPARAAFGLDYAPDFGVELTDLPEAWEIHRYDRP